MGQPAFKAPRPRQTAKTPSLRAERFRVTADPATLTKIRFALRALERSGSLKGTRSAKLSVRVDPGLIAEARRRTGLERDADLINAALAVIAASDGFGAWLVSQAGTLAEDFELAL